METTLAEQIKTREAAIGRELRPNEKMAMVRQHDNKDPDKTDLDIILSETAEGIQLKKDFDSQIKDANLVKNLHLRHVAVHAFERGKRHLLKRFRNNELQRIKKAD